MRLGALSATNAYKSRIFRPVGRAIGVPLAVALAAGPLPVIAIMLILVSDDANAKGVGFVLGR